MTLKKNRKIGVVGVTGVVGQELVKVFDERKKLFPKIYDSWTLLGFAGSARPTEGVLALDDSWDELGDCAFVINAAESDIALKIREKLKDSQILIDNSSAFRLDPDVPLIVPEINGSMLQSAFPVIANPNCTAIILTMILAPLREFGLSRVIVSTYQAASGAGLKGLQELENQISHWGDPSKWETSVFGFPLAGNILSHNTPIRAQGSLAEGYNAEEWKVVEETRKILGILHLPISATCMRVPVKRAHLESVTVDLKQEVVLEKLREVYQNLPGVKVVDDWKGNHFPMPLEAQDQDDVLVGRIRKDVSLPRTVHLICAGDQLRKGAATNALQIFEKLLAD